jgi:flagellar biosynthesis protein FlhG
LSFPDPYEEAPEPLRGARRLVVVGGGRGGVGKSLVAQNLAVYFAQLGKPVVLVDADATGANLHVGFGLRASSEDPPLDPESQAQFARGLLATSVPGLSLLPAPHDSILPPLALRAGRKSRWLARVRSLPAEYLVIDVGPGHGHFALDLMLDADIAICVTVPEPPAIETTYRFVRAAFRRRLKRALDRDRLRLGIMERAIAEIGTLPPPLELIRVFQRMDAKLAELAWAEANRMHLHLVVNQTRVRTDLELGTAMSLLSQRHLGVGLEELGHIEHDDTVWLTVRRNRPLLVDSPTSKAARNLERIARRVLAVTASRSESTNAARRTPEPSMPIPTESPSHYATLGIGRSSNDEEVRRAYKRQRELYATGGLATSSLLEGAQLKAEQTRLDEAYDTLLDPVRRRAYDLSTFPAEAEPEAAEKRSQRPQALAAEQLMLQAELAREIGPETEFTGALLRKVRESQGIELVEISQKTKIARAHLAAIEDEEWTSLPAYVYVRGFVNEVAKFLRLDPAQVQKTYMRRVREGTTAARGEE